jgi:hypothetical protein
MKRANLAKKTNKKVTSRKLEKKSTLKKEQNISTYQVSEGIVKFILDKIINISIHQSNMNKINSQINDYCFDYIQAQIEPLFEENFINYTKLKNDQNTLFWKTEKPQENQWIEILEPNTVENDRYESSGVNVQGIKNKKEKIDEIKEGNEHNENNENANREKINKTRMNKQKTLRLNINENKKENNKSENRNNQRQNTIKAFSTNQNNRGNKKIPLIEFPSEDIPGIDDEYKHEVYDPPNIHMLRKDIEEEMKNKEKELKLNNNSKKMNKKKDESDKAIRFIKPLDSNKFTFDSNGKIISFKQYKIENLSKDFTFIRNNIKEKIEKDESLNKPNIKQRLTIKEPKEIIIKDNRMNDYFNTEEKKDKKDKTKEKIIPSGSNFKLILPNIGVVIKENNDKKEGSRDFNKYFQKYSIKDYNKILNEYVPMQNKNKIKNKLDRLNTTSSIIHKQLSESIDRVNTNTINNTQMNITTINNKRPEKMNITNPLLTSNDNIQITENNIFTNQNSSFMKSTINNSFSKNNALYNPLMTSFNMRTGNLSQGKKGNNFNNSIIMKKLGTGSLKLEIESLQDLRSEPIYHKLNSVKKENIFEKNMIKPNKFTIKINSKDNPLYAFNKRILTDKNFGNDLDPKHKDEKQNIITSKHLSIQEAFKELGNTMINGIKIKFPRNRKVELTK